MTKKAKLTLPDSSRKFNCTIAIDIVPRSQTRSFPKLGHASNSVLETSRAHKPSYVYFLSQNTSKFQNIPGTLRFNIPCPNFFWLCSDFWKFCYISFLLIVIFQTFMSQGICIYQGWLVYDTKAVCGPCVPEYTDFLKRKIKT